MTPKTETPAGERTYGGLTASERAADRRRRLIAAAKQLFAAQSYAETGIRDVCRRAQVTERAMYELFDSLEDLLLTLYREEVDRHLERVVTAIAQAGSDPRSRIRAGVSAAIESWADDEEGARIMMLEIVGVSRRCEAERFAAVGRYVDMVAVQAAGGGQPTDDDRRLAVALVGAMIETAIDRLNTPPERRADPDAAIETLVGLFEAALLG